MNGIEPSANRTLARLTFLTLIVWAAQLFGSPPAAVASIGPPGAVVNTLAVDRFAPTTIYAGTSAGIYKSADEGATWSANLVLALGPTSQFLDNRGTGLKPGNHLRNLATYYINRLNSRAFPLFVIVVLMSASLLPAHLCYRFSLAPLFPCSNPAWD